jgi:hypothetical protein
MMIAVVAASVLAFLAAFQLLRIVPAAQAAIVTSRQTMAVMNDATLDERAKETAVQRAALSLMKGFLSLVLRSALALVAAWLPIELADLAGLVPAEATMAFLMRLDVIAVTSVIVVLVLWLGGRSWRS